MRWNRFMSHKNPYNRSISLIEALLATTILGITVTGLLTSFSAAMVMSKLSQDYSIVSSLMGDLHMYIRTNQLSPYTANTGTFTNHPGFTWEVNYQLSDTTNLYLVGITIKWRHGTRQHQLTQYTYHYFSLSGATNSTTSTG